MQFSESIRAARETKVLAFQEKVIFCSSIIWHWQRSGHLGDRRHWGRCGENTHETEPEDWVNPGAQPLTVLCDPEQETKPLGLKYRREHCSGPTLVAWWHTCGLMRAHVEQSWKVHRSFERRTEIETQPEDGALELIVWPWPDWLLV